MLALVATAAGSAPALAQKKADNGVGSQFEMVFWQTVSASEDRGQLEAYLTQYPNGTFAALARAKIAAMDKRAGGAAPQPVPTPVAVAPPPPPPPAPVPVVVAPVPVVAVPAPAVIAAPPPPPPPAPAIVNIPVPASAVPQAPPTPPAPAPAPAAAPAPAREMSLSDRLRELSQSQGARTDAGTSEATRAMLPPRPSLRRITSPAPPASFCSAMDRNSFYDSSYKPSMDLADQNYRDATIHRKSLQQAFEDSRQRGEVNAQNMFAAEAQAYDGVVRETYDARNAYESLFSRLMATPITPCGPVTP